MRLQNFNTIGVKITQDVPRGGRTIGFTSLRVQLKFLTVDLHAVHLG